VYTGASLSFLLRSSLPKTQALNSNNVKSKQFVYPGCRCRCGSRRSHPNSLGGFEQARNK
jgi:hypothetical protein